MSSPATIHLCCEAAVVLAGPRALRNREKVASGVIVSRLRRHGSYSWARTQPVSQGNGNRTGRLLLAPLKDTNAALGHRRLSGPVWH